MALGLIIELFGDGLLSLLERRKGPFAKSTARLVHHLRELAEPPEDVELRSGDGSTYTGFVIVERNELVMMIAVRHPPGASPPPKSSAPIVPPAPIERSLYHRGLLDPDDPRWDRDTRFDR